MIRALFKRPFATREEIDYIRAAIVTPKILLHRELHLARATRMAQTLATHFDGPVHVSNYPVHRALHKLG